jgi:hypothetical protein
MNKEKEEYNGVKFMRDDMEDGDDFTFILAAPEIVKRYKDQFDIGNIVTSITICEDGTLLMNAVKVREESD